MSDAVPVVWLDSGGVRDDAARALDDWARARGITLALPRPTSAVFPLAAPPEGLANEIEEEIERAREAIGGGDAAAVERAIGRAETSLRNHPELPQAAWLRAEVERSWASRWLRVEPRDRVRAERAFAAAVALDDGRATGIGEVRHPDPERLPISVIVDGTASEDAALFVDGRPVPRVGRSPEQDTRVVALAAGEHQLLAYADGLLVFASWVTISPSAPARVEVTVDDPGSCSAERFARARRDGLDVVVPRVSCPSWLAAAAGEARGSVLVARCGRGACGRMLEWRVDPYDRPGPPQILPRRSTWPAWATWTLVGVGAAAAASVALVASGVFDARPVEHRFVVGGARQP